ncbi:MAG: hypothetical protein RBU29_14015, partial [bacterium]|nr:hypothetical protein [bacterium]
KRAAITEAERAILQNTAQADAAAVSALQHRTLVEALQQTIDALDNTTHADPSPSLTRAYSHAQEAYRLLLAMRPDTVSIQQQLAQGQEGQTQAAAQRPDIQALESTRRRNVYEEERRTQQTLEQTDDTLSKIKELAARQQSINDEMAALISELQKEEDAEALRRRLERLQEEAQRNLERLDETNRSLAANDLRDPNVRDAMQELNETRQWMNRSLDDLRGGQVQSARNAGIRAADSLQTIEEELNQFSREMAANRLADLQTQMQTLQEQQRHIQDQLQQLIEKQATPTLTLEPQEDPDKTALLQQKEALAQQFLNTLNQAGDLAQRAEQSQPVASRLLNDWLRETSQRGIAEDMRRERSLPAIHYGAWDSAREIEETIQRKLQDSAHALEPIAEALIGSDLEGMQKAYAAMQRLLTMQPDPPTTGPIHDATETAPSPMQADTTISSVSSSQETGETSSSTTGASSSSIGNTTGNRASPHDTSAPNSRDVTTNEAPPRTTQHGVATSWNRGAFDPTAMDRFFGEDPRDGLDMVRNAEQWLPQGNPLRDRLSEIRENIETMRGQSKRESQPPRFDLFVEQIANPLVRTTEQLGDEISKKLAEDAFVLVDEQSVPPQYQDTVADYFKAIAEAEPAP